jgi:hypothetical protein
LRIADCGLDEVKTGNCAKIRIRDPKSEIACWH